ncbi:NUDIX domain-containing protein [Enteractinococcus helveticum]
MFPGGKPEPAETSEHIAVREVAEEFAVVVAPGRARALWRLQEDRS